jgi:hypothetical protein
MHVCRLARSVEKWCVMRFLVTSRMDEIVESTGPVTQARGCGPPEDPARCVNKPLRVAT